MNAKKLMMAAVAGGCAAVARLSDPTFGCAAAVLDCRMADLSGPAVVTRVRACCTRYRLKT